MITKEEFVKHCHNTEAKDCPNCKFYDDCGKIPVGDLDNPTAMNRYDALLKLWRKQKLSKLLA